MAYLDQTAGRADPKALAATVGIHVAMGALLVSGLAVTGVIKDVVPPLTADPITIPLPPPPPAPKEVQPDPQVPPRSEVFVPKPLVPLEKPSNPGFAESEPMVNSGGMVIAPNGADLGDFKVELPQINPEPKASPTMKPTRPVPRGEPGSWVTTQDYRSRWVNEGLTGTARFRLSVGKDGRVTGCEITRSTGHAALDSATCSLIQRRARFTPSKDGAGNPVAGTYENAVVWRLPD